MDANDYQHRMKRTLIDVPDFDITPAQVMIVWNAIGLAGEAGEVADLVKKGIFHQQGLDTQKLVNELGDVLWYVAALCTHLGVSLGDVMQGNLDKIRARYPNGWDAWASTKKWDETPDETADPHAGMPLIVAQRPPD